MMSPPLVIALSSHVAFARSRMRVSDVADTRVIDTCVAIVASLIPCNLVAGASDTLAGGIGVRHGYEPSTSRRMARASAMRHLRSPCIVPGTHDPCMLAGGRDS